MKPNVLSGPCKSSASNHPPTVITAGLIPVRYCQIERDFHGDARFPAFEPAAWREVAREVREPASDAGFAYHFATYERVHD